MMSIEVLLQINLELLNLVVTMNFPSCPQRCILMENPFGSIHFYVLFRSGTFHVGTREAFGSVRLGDPPAKNMSASKDTIRPFLTNSTKNFGSGYKELSNGWNWVESAFPLSIAHHISFVGWRNFCQNWVGALITVVFQFSSVHWFYNFIAWIIRAVHLHRRDKDKDNALLLRFAASAIHQSEVSSNYNSSFLQWHLFYLNLHLGLFLPREKPFWR